tara:strand:- start:5958 stop:6566 length:609 start_codon:yes stop_codon:yes gene_type:complete
MIIILDYGISNIGAVKNALNFLNFKSIISSKKDEIKTAKKIIIPGNGNFGEGMRLLQKLNLIEILDKVVIEKKIPVLGICLGYQMMFEKNEEDLNYNGLGWIKGRVKKFKKTNKFLVPHVGWNKIDFQEMKLMAKIPNNSRFYFDHSYYTEISSKKFKCGTTNHGIQFNSVYSSKNIYGCQPHPEKSQKFGLQLLKNFCELC